MENLFKELDVVPEIYILIRLKEIASLTTLTQLNLDKNRCLGCFLLYC